MNNAKELQIAIMSNIGELLEALAKDADVKEIARLIVDYSIKLDQLTNLALKNDK